MKTIYVPNDFLNEIRKTIDPRDLFTDNKTDEKGERNYLFLSFMTQEKICFAVKGEAHGDAEGAD